MQAQGDAAAAYGALTEALHLAQAVGPRLFVPASIERLASVVTEHGQADLTVRLLSTASVLRLKMGAPVWPADQATVDHTLASVRSMIGADTFAAAWAEAQALPVEQILNGLPNVTAFAALGDR